MRAPFNRLANFYFGPATPTPGVLRQANVPCRLVADWPFTDNEIPLSVGQNYLTCDAYLPSGPPATHTELQLYEYDFGKADVVALVPGGPITHQVLRVETRNWFSGELYYRAHISHLLDTLPSVCSLSYADVYRIVDYATGEYNLTRIGPTTWVGGEWTFEAEAGSFDPETCNSVWTLTHTTRGVWSGTWNGIGFVALDNPDTTDMVDAFPYIV